MSATLEAQIRGYAEYFEETQIPVSFQETTGRATLPILPDNRGPDHRPRRWAIAAAVALGVIVVALNLVFAGRGRDSEPVTSTTSPASSDVTNGWIAYTTERNEAVGDIWVVREGEEPRRIIGSSGDEVLEVCPRFSPDGTRLAYSESKDFRGPGSDPTSRATRTVVVVAISDEGAPGESILRAQAPDGDGPVCPEWSPDGTKLAYYDPLGKLSILGFDGSRAEIISDRLADWEWAPDSSHIAAVRSRDSIEARQGLWLFPVSGAEPTMLIEAPGDPDVTWFTDLSWSPDGTEIVVSFIDGKDAEVESPYIGRLRLDTAEIVDVQTGRKAIWSPNGEWIAYEGPTEGPGSMDSGVAGRLMLIDTRSGEPGAISSQAGGEWGHTWSPDSSRLVHVEYTGDLDFLLVSASVGGDSPKLLADHGVDLYFTSHGTEDLSWQPVFP